MDNKEAFEQWWYASKYCQVALGASKQVAFDGWQAACAYQKQKDALIADSFYQDIRQYTTDVPNISGAILGQGEAQ